MKENYFLDDGAYAVVKILIECVRRRLEGQGGIGELLATLPEPAEASEFRLKIEVQLVTEYLGCLYSDVCIASFSYRHRRACVRVRMCCSASMTGWRAGRPGKRGGWRRSTTRAGVWRWMKV